MPQKAPNILVGGMFLESHSFVPRLTTLNDFVIVDGDELLAKAAGSASALGGGVRHLKAVSANIIPTFSAVAPPGGCVEHGAFCHLRDRLLEAISRHRPDGVFLDLHGAMGSTMTADTEGELVGQIRDLVGPDVPIAVGLDMHANMTPRMLAATPIWVACKHNPHTDYAEAGARAAGILMESLIGDVRCETCAIWLPALLPGKLSTEEGPLQALHKRRRELERCASLLDVSIYNAYMFLDGSPGGQCITATSKPGDPASRRVVEELAGLLWETREEYSVDRPSIGDALATHEPGRGPLILGDHGDRVLGGGAGDGTFLLRYFLHHRADLKVLLTVTDPIAVDCAMKAQPGDSITCPLGGCITATEVPVDGTWELKRTSDGKFVQEGPFLANEPADMGPTVVLTAGNCTIITTSKPGFSQDPQAFLSNGEDPRLFDVVVCKSGFHFELAFRRIGTCVAVDTPGMTNYVPGHFRFHARPPLWPEDPGVSPDFRVQLYSVPRSAGGTMDA